MDKTSIMQILECCLLSLDGSTKEQMIEFGCPENLVDMGIKLCDFLKSKNEVKVSH